MKWHLVSRAGGETDITLDDFMAKLDPASVAEGTKQAQPWLAAIKARASRADAAQTAAEQSPLRGGQARGQSPDGAAVRERREAIQG